MPPTPTPRGPTEVGGAGRSLSALSAAAEFAVDEREQIFLGLRSGVPVQGRLWGATSRLVL